MFLRLLKFELGLHARQIAFWVTLFIMLGLGLLTTTDFFSLSFQGGAKVKANGAIPLAGSISFLSLIAVFFAAVFTVTGVMRDETHKSLEIIHSTPVKTRDMVMSRMSGVWLVTFLCIFAAVIGMFLGQFAPWADKETFQAVNVLHYLQPSLFFTVMNALFVTSFFMFIAATSRNKSLVYVSAIALFALYMSVQLFIGEDADRWLTSLADPFGMSALALTTEFWPAVEQNERMLPLAGYFGGNRLLWGLVTLALLFGSYRLFTRGLVTRKTKRSSEEKASQTTGRIVLHPLTPDTSAKAQWLAYFERVKMEYSAVIKSVPFVILLGVALAIFGIAAYMELIYSPDANLPTSTRMAGLAIGGFGFTLLIVMVFFGGDMIWRDRTYKFNEILDSTPTGNSALMGAKWTALSGVIFTLIFAALLLAMIVQIIIGDVPVNLMTYAKIGVFAFGISLIFDLIMVLFIQSFMPNRILGMLLAAGLVIGMAFINQLPFYHPLMAYGSVNPGSYSEISGFSHMTSFKWWLPYWSSFALILTIVSIWLWRRGLQSSLRARMSGLKSRMTPLTSSLAVLGVIGFLATGSGIFKAYNIDNDWRFQKEREQRRVDYEKMVRPLLDIELPRVRSVSVEAQIYPKRQESVFTGQYDIENTTGAPLSVLYIDMASHDEGIIELRIDGAEVEIKDKTAIALEDHNIRQFNFNPPLAVDATTTLYFENFFHKPRLADGSITRRNGTFVNNTQVLPQLGLPKSFLSDPDKRRKYDLPKLEKAAERTDMDARKDHYITQSSDYVDFKATVCTDESRTPIAPGQLKRSAIKDGRHCRDYQAINPILNFFSFLSADYAVREDVWNNPYGDDIDISIYHHEPHDYNVDLMVEAVKAGLGSYSKRFGPYQYAQARIMEFPGGNFAQAFAGTIPFSENVGFVRDPGNPEDPDSIDIATYITLHEIAHQWFAHQIVPAHTKGSTLLSEGLSEYAAYSAYEEMFGWERTKSMIDRRTIQDYLIGRTLSKKDEPSLAEVENQGYIHYNKAAWVFWGLRHYIGNDVLADAIKGFVTEYGSKGPLYPTSLQLIDAIRDAAGPEYDMLITDYFDRLTFWELSFAGDDPQFSHNKNGTYDVSFTVKLDKKIASEEDGKETSVLEDDIEELDEWVEIGFYDKDPKDSRGAGWLVLERLRLSEAETKLSFVLDAKPTHILLDPRRLLIERADGDNVKEIKAAETVLN